MRALALSSLRSPRLHPVQPLDGVGTVPQSLLLTLETLDSQVERVHRHQGFFCLAQQHTLDRIDHVLTAASILSAQLDQPHVCLVQSHVKCLSAVAALRAMR